MARATIIGPGTRVPGPLHSTDDLEIEGTVEGNVVGQARVLIHPTARIQGTVSGREVIVGGKLNESVIAREGVRLLKTAELRGDVQAPRIAIEEGALFEGQVRMTRAAAVSPSPATTSPPAATARPPAPTNAQRAAPELAVPGRRRLHRRPA